MLFFWINLEKRTDRRAHMESLISFCPFGLKPSNIRRVSAIVPEDVPRLCRRSRFSNSEIACLCSHLECMRLGVIDSDDEDDWMVIGEDDVKGFHSGVDLEKVLANAPDDSAIIQLCTGHPDAYQSSETFSPWKGCFFNTILYACRRSKAKVFLQDLGMDIEKSVKTNSIDLAQFPFNHEADTYLYMSLRKTYTFGVPLCSFNVDLGSDVQHTGYNDDDPSDLLKMIERVNDIFDMSVASPHPRLGQFLRTVEQEECTSPNVYLVANNHQMCRED